MTSDPAFVLFYDAKALRAAKPGFWPCCLILLCQLWHGRKALLHCHLKWGPWIFHGGPGTKTIQEYAAIPTLKVRVGMPDFARCFVFDFLPFSLARWIQDALGLRRHCWLPGNCINATAALLGFDGHFRSPQSLLERISDAESIQVEEQGANDPGTASAPTSTGISDCAAPRGGEAEIADIISCQAGGTWI